MLNKFSLKNLKNKIISICIAIGLITTAMYGLFAIKNTNTVYAYNSDPANSSTYFSDPEFNQGGTSPTYWKVIDGQGNYNSEVMASGIFNSSSVNTSYLKTYKVFNDPGKPVSNPSNSETYKYLSLSAPYPAGGNFGFKPSSSKLNLNKNSFYVKKQAIIPLPFFIIICYNAFYTLYHNLNPRLEH